MNGLEQLMLDHSSELLMLVDPVTLQIVLANARASSVLGYPADQMKGLPITAIESALQDVFYWEDVRNGIDQELHQQEDQYLSFSGELLSVSKSIRRLPYNNQSLILVQATLTQDVQNLQETLAQTLSQLRATLESTGNGILVVDWQGKITGMNRQFSRMWAISQALLDAHDDQQLLEFITRSVQESALMASRLAAIVAAEETTDTVKHNDGRVFEIGSRPQYLDEQIVGRVFSVQDVTQRTLDAQALRDSRDQMEARVRSRTADLHSLNTMLLAEKERLAVLVKELEAAQAQLMQSERMASIGQLAAGVAHEINNPVGYVSSNLGSLQHYVGDLLRLLSMYQQTATDLPEAARDRVAAVMKEIDFEFMQKDITELLNETLEGLKRVTRIVQDLKNFSHVGETENQWADLETGLDSTLRVVWNELKYKAEVVKEYAGMPQVWCFPFQLNQVFMNLLVNASHAIQEKGKITLRTGFDESQVWIQVQDSGVGISAENLKRIFDPFFTTKPVGKGTGLGLSLSYDIVKKHGGHIDVTSEPGAGATFTVYLPRRTPEQAAAKP